MLWKHIVVFRLRVGIDTQVRIAPMKIKLDV